MKRLILTTSDSGAGCLKFADIADPNGRQFPAIKIAGKQLELASSVWRAWREQGPQDWLGLLSKDLSALPQLRPAVVALLDELPRSR
ncbi:MAG: hypothetical protein KGK16_05175 [Bradyrhizobium sp.]|nr:hypothetical protein [Bradyrhizobium sp.]